MNRDLYRVSDPAEAADSLGQMVDLELYVELVEWFDRQEQEGTFMGGGEAAVEWFRPRVADEALDYVLRGCLALVGHWKAEGWVEESRQPGLDRLVWTWHRVWVDRYGWEPTMKAGKERQERWAEQMKPRR